MYIECEKIIQILCLDNAVDTPQFVNFSKSLCVDKIEKILGYLSLVDILKK